MLKKNKYLIFFVFLLICTGISALIDEDSISSVLLYLIGIINIVFVIPLRFFYLKYKEKRKNKNINYISKNNVIVPISKFYQIDKSQIELLYDTYTKETYQVEKKIENEKTNLGLKSKIGLSSSIENISIIEKKMLPKTIIDKCNYCIDFLINENNIVLDLDNLVLDENKLKKFDDFIEESRTYPYINIPKAQIEEQRKKIKLEIIESLLKAKLKGNGFNCFLDNCELVIKKYNSLNQLITDVNYHESSEYELEMVHPISNYLDNVTILVKVIPLKETITPYGLNFFHKNLNKTTSFSVFGQAHRVMDKQNNIEIIIEPYAIL